MKIAIEGCCHGELDAIYRSLHLLSQKMGVMIDLLICCGDFQSVRNEADLECLACPPKYRHMNTFYKYYSGEAVAPVPTIFIGGNHEASNHLWELQVFFFLFDFPSCHNSSFFSFLLFPPFPSL